MSAAKQVWVVSDGIPGHFNQSTGIVMALQRHQPCEVVWLDVKLRAGLWRRVLRWLLNATEQALPLAWLSWFYRVDALPPGRPDMLVGAGGKASFALAWLARHYAAPAVFSGSLRGLQARHFGLILSIEPKHAGRNTLIVDIAPMPVDLAAQQQAGAALRSQLGLGAQPVWLLLIGGDGAGYRYQADDWQRLAQQVRDIANHQGVRWLISTSRRTGAEAEAILRAQLSDVAADAVWWDSEPRKVLSAYLGAAEVVCCSADSLSMLTEAVASQRRVIAWQPAQAAPDDNYRAALQRLQQRGLIVCVEDLRQGAERIAGQSLTTISQDALAWRLQELWSASGHQDDSK